ncbi:hypothetical protein PMAYCL1PPCAC_25314, partial [Pristionchus mayeri]
NPKMCVKTRIHLTKVTGMRTIPQFDFTSPFSLSDAALIVEDKNVHVNKQYLSSVSTVFRTLFDENSSGNHNEFVLNGVKYEVSLQIIISKCSNRLLPISEDVLYRMIVLAKRFNVLFVIDQIARYLRSTEENFTVLKIILHFGYASHLQVIFSLHHHKLTLWQCKALTQYFQNSVAYEEMEDDKAR